MFVTETIKPFPSSIHWAGVDFKIKIVKNLDGNESWGRTHFATAEIFIEEGVTLPKQWETLIHELLHLAYRQTAHTQLDDKLEEQIVKPWSHNIFAVLKDNGLLNI